MKDYKRILQGVVNIINITKKSDIGFANICSYIGENCPELAEPEDKKVRKTLIRFFEDWRKTRSHCWGVSIQKILAWLEKQGEQKEYTFKSLPRLLDMIEPTSKAKAYCQKLIDALVKEGYTTDAKIVGECLKAMNGENVPMAIMDEKQGEQKPTESSDIKSVLLVHDETLNNILERYKTSVTFKPLIVNLQNWWNNTRRHLFSLNIEQKPADKVEPKFNVGDWVVHDMSDGRVSPPTQIVDMTNKSYVFDTEECFYFSDAEEVFRKWTIQDAKDGDVLATKTGGVFIYKELLYDKPFAYCGVDKFGVFKDCNCGDGLDWTPYPSEVTPAIKEQRDTLMKAMADKGYTFDFEKKELKKIEEPENYKRQVMSEMTDLVKDYITQKPTAWSEEDERLFQIIIDILDKEEHKGHLSHTDLIACVRKLKSLKEKVQPQTTWRPNDEQIVALRWVLNNIPYCTHKEEISGLLEQLKELKG